jgi:hypothetical protein
MNLLHVLAVDKALDTDINDSSKGTYPRNRPWRSIGLRRRGSHIAQTVGSQMAARLSAPLSQFWTFSNLLSFI